MHVQRSPRCIPGRAFLVLLPLVVVSTLPRVGAVRAQIPVSTDFAYIGQRGVSKSYYAYSFPGTVSRLLFFEGKLILGGNYDKAGKHVTNLATWDGSTWGTFDDGTVGGGRAMTIHKSKLVVAQHIWDDPGWRYLLGTTHTQISLAQVQGDMPGLPGQNWGLAGAGLALPDPYPLPYHVMRWSGFEWIELGTYSESPYGNDAVLAMTELDGDLVVGGWLHEIEGVPVSAVARWDGATWSPMGTAITDRLYQFERFQGDLYAACFEGLFRWNGTDWDVVPGTESHRVESLTVHGDALVVGGSFSTIATATSRNIAAWNGTTWTSFTDLGVQYEDVLALASDGTTLYAGGEYTATEGLPISGIARWTGSNWENMGGPGLGVIDADENTVRAFVPFGGELVVAGAMPGWGTVALHGIGLLEADRWVPLGDGFDDVVTSVAVYDGDLYAGGYFLQSGASPTPKLARWNGLSWTALAPSVDQNAETMIVHDDHLVIGGEFTQIGGTAFDHLAQWDGGAFTAVGGGRPGSVYALTELDGDLIVATKVSQSEEVTGVERWDGATWMSMGDSFDARVVTLAVHDGRLFAGGEFTMVGAAPVNHVAEWNGSSWQALDAGTNGAVRALASHGDHLYVVGEFTQAGGLAASRLAAWSSADGQWVDLGIGLSWYGLALYSAPEGLYIGGDFVQLSTPNGIVESVHVARLDLPLPTAVTEGPPVRASAIESVFPNPINPSTTIVYHLEQPGFVQLAIYDARGRQIRALEEGPAGEGRHRVQWHGDDGNGRPVGSGVYYVRLSTGGSVFGHKVVVAR
jgi:hypothetical protein